MLKKVMIVVAILGCTLESMAAGTADRVVQNIPISLGSPLNQISLKEHSNQKADEYNMRGLYYARQQAYEQAVQDFLSAQSLAETQSKRDSYTNNLAMTYKAMGKYELALDTINTVVTMEPDMVSALDTKGDILISLKQYAEAESYLTQAILLNPDIGTSYYNRGRVHELMGEKNKALADYRQAVSLPGDYQKEALEKIKEMQKTLK